MKPTLKAGAIIFSRDNPDKIAVLHQQKYNDYSFAKGHLEAGETLQECAVREVKEETGLDIELLRALPPFHYHNTKDGDVEVAYFLARSLDDSTVQTETGGTLYWMSAAEALDKISYENLRRFFKENITDANIHKNS